ncbi:MAG TPA: hypothetical protein VF748_15070 [Candidatus Acidoferrum sp.]
MPTLFKPGTMVVVSAPTPAGVKVSGNGGDHTGKKGKVRGYADLSPLYSGGDVHHIVDLAYWDEDGKKWVWYGTPFSVPNETPNPPDQYGRKIHGDAPLPDQPVHWIEVPASCLS